MRRLLLSCLVCLACSAPSLARAQFTIPNNDVVLNADQSRVFSTDIAALVQGFKGDGVLSGCAVSAQGSPNMTVAVASGTVVIAGVQVSVSSGNLTITAANSTRPRIDLVVVNNSGTKSTVDGTAATSPQPASIPASSVLLAMVYVPAGDTAINSNQITDKRVVVYANVSISGRGIAPIAPNDATKYLDGTGSYSTPSGTGTVTHTAGALTANRIVLGNGSADITVLGSLGTTTTLLHGNAGGAPTFAAVDLANDVSGNLGVSHLDSGNSASNTTFWRGDGVWATPAGAGNVTTSVTLTSGKVVLGNGSSDLVLSSASGVAHLSSGTLTGSNVDVASEITGTVPVANGGTNLTSATDDTTPVGNGTTWQAKTLPDCTDTGGNHLNYTQSSNTYSCGTSGGGSGAMVQLAQITTSSSQATIDFTSISGSYTTLKIIGTTRDTQAGTSSAVLRVKINNDGTSGNYATSQYGGVQNNIASIGQIAASAAGVFMSGNPQDGNTAGMVGQVEITIANYANTTFHKRISSWAAYEDGTVGESYLNIVANWKSTAAITRVTIGTDGTAFKDGLTFTLYGLQ